nr:hypothetical protein [Tanacetum cinerariifolium]
MALQPYFNGVKIQDLMLNQQRYIQDESLFYQSLSQTSDVQALNMFNKINDLLKQVNDITRLQALVDRKKVVVTEATIREALRLNDEEGVDCLPNEEIFAELARIGYEKPSTKLTFYKAFFSSQWKFLIHTILQCMSAKRTSWNEFSSLMASAVICLSSGDISTHTTKYTSPALTQKVFVNMRRVGKGFSGVETPLFEGMLVEQEIIEDGDAAEHVEEVNTGDATKGDDSAAHGEVPTITEEPSIPSLTPPTPPPQPPQDIPSTSHVQQTPLQSPQVQPPSPQPQPQQAADFPMSLLQEAIDACTALTRIVEHLEYDKVAQALEITKLKRRVKKMEKRNKVRVLKLRRLQKVGTSQRVETSDDTVMDDESNQGRMIAEMDQDDAVVLKDDKEEDKEVSDAVKNVEEAKVDESAQVQGRQVESQAKIYKIDMDHANKVLSMHEDKTEPAKVQEVVDVVTTAKLITEVVTAASETVTAASAIITTAEPQVSTATTVTLTAAPVRVADAPSRRRKGVIIRDPKEESTTSTIIPAETKSKDKEKAAKRRKLNKEVEDLKRHLQIVPNEDDDVYTEFTPLARKVRVMDYEIIEMNNKPYYKIIRADGTHQLYISKGQELEATGIMWCVDHNLYNYTVDFVSGKKIPTLKIYSRPDVECRKTSSRRGE